MACGMPDDPTRRTRVWQRSGASIPGATGQQYVLTSSDAGALVGVMEFAENAYTDFDGGPVLQPLQRGRADRRRRSRGVL